MVQKLHSETLCADLGMPPSFSPSLFSIGKGGQNLVLNNAGHNPLRDQIFCNKLLQIHPEYLVKQAVQKKAIYFLYCDSFSMA